MHSLRKNHLFTIRRTLVVHEPFETFSVGRTRQIPISNLLTKADFPLSKYALGIQIGEALFIRRVGQGIQSHRSQAAADENQP